MVDPIGPLLIECDRLEEFAARTEGARIGGDNMYAFGTVPFDDI